MDLRRNLNKTELSRRPVLFVLYALNGYGYGYGAKRQVVRCCMCHTCGGARGGLYSAGSSEDSLTGRILNPSFAPVS